MLVLAVISTFLATLIVAYFKFKTSPDLQERLKLILSYIYLRWLSRKPPLFHFDFNSKDLGELGIVSLPKAVLVEYPRALETHQHAVDGVRFSAVNTKGQLLVIQLNRRHNRTSEVSLFLRLSDHEEYQLPLQPDTTVYNTDGKTFTASGLCLEVLEPLKKWRINFNGYLRRTVKKDCEPELVIAKINASWSPLLNYVSFPEDYSPAYIANYLAGQNNISPFQFNKMEWSDCLEQFGQIRGSIHVNNETRNVLLRGLKQRTHGFDQLDQIQHRVSIEGVLENGRSFHLFIENIKGGLQKFLYGYVCPPCNMDVHHIDQCHLDVSSMCDDNYKPTQLNFDFVAKKTLYKFSLVVRDDVNWTAYYGENRDILTRIYSCDVMVNDKSGKAILQFSKLANNGHHISPIGDISFPLLNQIDLDETNKLVVTFSDAECRSGLLVGGKGASLSLMTDLTNAKTEFSVPVGICLTKEAFNQHIQQNTSLIKAIEHLQKTCCCAGSPPQLQEECQKLVNLIELTSSSSKLQDEVDKMLTLVSGVDYFNKYFAVRSSAIGEDGEDLSAAGQNETFLGIRGIDQICVSVIQCWASQFSFRSVEYQRQNGQLINKGMAVVIQEMVDADVAGVLFSRDPVTGCPDKIYITSNYGLGETVVSGSVDPDTIVIHRSWDDQLTLSSVEIGSKGLQINVSSASGTVETKVDSLNSSKCSLTEGMAMKLSKLAILLEKSFGSSRDIEWAIKGEIIYLLQSRPVTTDNPLTDDEIIHEFDSGTKSDFGAYSTANVAEVFPEAITPITHSSYFRGMEPFLSKTLKWQHENHRFDPSTNDHTICIFNGRVFIDMMSLKSWTLKDKKSDTDKAFEFALYGRILDDDDITSATLDRYSIRPSFKQANQTNKGIFMGVFLAQWLLQKSAKVCNNLRIPTKNLKNVADCLKAIEGSLIQADQAMNTHFKVTMASTIWNLMTLNIISRKNKELSAEQYADFAALIGSFNGAESGNVPASLEELATVISEEIDAKTFSKMPINEAFIWLEKNGTRSNKKFKEFLERHGHRGLHELDMGCTTWGMEPQQVTKALQGMLHSGPPKEKAKMPTKNAIDQVKTPLTPFKKFLLKWILKGCRNAVCNREEGKSHLVKAYDHLRKGYRHLGQLMVEQGYFTDPYLVMFFTHEELRAIVSTRSPKLLKRAKHRQRLYKVMCDFKFPEIMREEPAPININVDMVSSGVKVKGLPVSQGSCKGFARVITSLEDVNTIQPGEILITHGTDIGWTPYFPMLSGVVTELGGLISHGAVVARECGLPCIVGVENATHLFQTGDSVYLNATEGYIIKVNSE